MTDPIWFTFATTHHALWAEEVARAAGVPTDVVPAPPGTQARCNLALQTLPEEEEALEAALRREAVPFELFPAPGG